MIFLTGGAGYIGSHLSYLLQDRREEFVILDSFKTGKREAIPSGCTVEEIDLRDTARLAKLFSHYRPNSVIHLAASLDVKESTKDPIAYYDNNVAATISLLSCCKQYPIQHLLFSSTAAVYGTREEQPFTEDDPCNPQSPYGLSKHMAEKIIQDCANALSFSYAISRFFNVIGADPRLRTGQHRDGSHLVSVCLSVARGELDFVPVYGTDYPTKDGTAIRDYIHVSDCVTAQYELLSYLRQNGKSGIFNVGNNQGQTVLEIIEAAQLATGKSIPFKEYPKRSADPTASIADNTKLRTLTNWRPKQTTTTEAIRSAWLWEQKLHPVK